MDTDSRAEEIIKRQERLAADRSTLDTHCEEIAERILPRMKGAFTSTSNTSRSMQGEKNTEKMLDSTGAIALERFVAVLDSMLTPQNSKWHRLRSTDPTLNRDSEVARWFDAVNDILFRQRYAPEAGFATQNHERYVSLGAFGTGTLFVDKREKGGLRYRCYPLSELYMLENHQGIVDTIHRRFRNTARQAVQKFKKENLPEKIVKAAADKPEQEFEFIHCVAPREDAEYGRLDYRGMPWASHYVSIEGKKVVEEGGFTSWPYPTGRYVQAPGETYGRSPAMTVLPNIKVLNEQKRTMLKMGHRLVDPILLAHDDGVIDAFSMKPGALNFGGIDSQGRKLVAPLDMPQGQLQNLDKLMDAERGPVNDAFLVTLFQILVESPTMTATEVLERTREKGLLMNPTLARQMSDYLGPLIEREIDVLNRQGMLPPMPALLAEAGGEYEIVYESPLARNMRYEEGSGLMRLIEMAGTYANATQDPRPLDHFDFDAAIPALGDILGVPARWLHTPAEVQALRDKRDQAAQLAQLTQAAPGAAAVIKALKPTGAAA